MQSYKIFITLPKYKFSPELKIGEEYIKRADRRGLLFYFIFIKLYQSKSFHSPTI